MIEVILTALIAARVPVMLQPKPAADDGRFQPTWLVRRDPCANLSYRRRRFNRAGILYDDQRSAQRASITPE